MERKFEVLGKSLKNNVSDCLQNIKKDVFTYGEKLKEVFTSMKNDLGNKTFSQKFIFSLLIFIFIVFIFFVYVFLFIGIYIKYESIDTATNIPNQSNINNLKKNIINESVSNILHIYFFYYSYSIYS